VAGGAAVKGAEALADAVKGAGKSIRQAVAEINRVGLNQADAVKVIETVVQASGKRVGGVVKLPDGSIAMLGKFGGAGQPVVIVSENGAAVFGTATVTPTFDATRGVVMSITDFVPK
jgi:hypothetical protein